MMWQAALIVLMLVATILQPDTAIGRLLNCSVFQWLGRMSYSLYLWNNFFMLPLQVKPISHYHFDVFQTFPLNYIALFGVSFLSYYFIERPLIRLGYVRTSYPTIIAYFIKSK